MQTVSDGGGASTSKSAAALKRAVAANKAAQMKVPQVNAQNAIGKGMEFAMNQIYDMTLGPGINALTRQGDASKMTPTDALTLATMGLGTGMFGKAAGVGARAADLAIAKNLAAKALTTPGVSVVTPRSVSPWINYAGRFKTQLETEPLNPRNATRVAVEEKLFGVPVNAPGDARPFYGALTNTTNLSPGLTSKIPGVTGDFLRATNPYTNRSIFFGRQEPIIHFLGGDKMRGTYTIGDSWSPSMANGKAIVNQLNTGGQTKAQAAQIIDIISNIRQNRQLSKNPDEVLPYIEAQLYPDASSANFIQKVQSAIGANDLWRASGKAKAAAKLVQQQLQTSNKYLADYFPNAQQASFAPFVPQIEQKIFDYWKKTN